MTLTKLVDGERRNMTAQEETDHLAFQSASALEITRKDLREAFIAEGIARINIVWPELNALFGNRLIEGMDFVESMVTHGLFSFAGADAGAILTRDIRDFVRDDAIPTVNATATQAALDAIDPTAAEPFGPGNPAWPI